MPLFIGLGLVLLCQVADSLEDDKINEPGWLQATTPVRLLTKVVRSGVVFLKTRQETIAVEPPSLLNTTQNNGKQVAEQKHRDEVALDDVRSVATWPKLKFYDEVLISFPGPVWPINSAIEEMPLEIQKDLYSQFQTWIGSWQDMEILVQRLSFRPGLNPAPKIALSQVLESWCKRVGSRGFKTYGIVPRPELDATAISTICLAVTKENLRCKMETICWNSGDVQWTVMAISHRQSEDGRVDAIIGSVIKNASSLPIIPPAPPGPKKPGGYTSFYMLES